MDGIFVPTLGFYQRRQLLQAQSAFTELVLEKDLRTRLNAHLTLRRSQNQSDFESYNRTHRVIVCGTRLERPVAGRGEWSDVMFDEKVLVFCRVNPPKGSLNVTDSAFQNIEMTQL
jgi:hypothetical protein